MTDRRDPSHTTPKDARAERLAEALRANLRRRKAQARSRRESAAKLGEAGRSGEPPRGD